MKSLISAAALSVLFVCSPLVPQAIAARPITTGVQRVQNSSDLMSTATPPKTASSSSSSQSTAGVKGFLAAPRLVRFSTDYTNGDFPADYQVTVTLPADAGRSLKAIQVMQVPNSENVQFTVNQTAAMLASGVKVPIASIGGLEQSGTATIVFDQPVAPGETVTINLPVKANPSSGIYLFDVTAFPEGENVRGQSLGKGRLHFYNS